MTDEKWPGSTDQSQTQPIVPPATGVAVAEPPPSGFENESPDTEAAPIDWQARYEEQKRRTTLFMGAAVVAVAALIGSLFFAVARGNAADDIGRGGITGPTQQFGGPGGTGMPGPGMRGMPGRGFDDHDGRELDDSPLSGGAGGDLGDDGSGQDT